MTLVQRLTSATILAVGACSQSPRRGEPIPAPAPEPTPALAAEDSTPSKVRVVALPQSISRPALFRAVSVNTVDQFVLYVPLPSDSGECSARQPSPTGEGEMAVLNYPSRAAPISVSIVVIAANGRLVRFTDRRGGIRLAATPGLTRAQQDSAVVSFLRRVPRTTIRLEYRTGRAFVMNEGADLPADGFTVPIHWIARHPRYDAPDDRARAIAARCR